MLVRRVFICDSLVSAPSMSSLILRTALILAMVRIFEGRALLVHFLLIQVWMGLLRILIMEGLAASYVHEVVRGASVRQHI